MHKMLQRQLKQARQASAAGELDVELLLQLIDAAYDEFDRERRYTAHAHQVMRDEQAELLKRQLRSTEELAAAESARAAAEAELLDRERLSLLGQLTASVAHELRNPLSTIRNTIHAIHQTAREKGLEIDRQMHRVQRTIERCDGIIDDLLDYAGNSVLHAVPIPLDAWLGRVLDEQKLPASIALERRLGAGDAPVPLDPQRLRCAVTNLIENAAEAMVDAPDLAERRITITSTLGEVATITIADTGPGMTPDVLARAFEPLFSTRGFGTGLGLPTVKHIVEQHGGTITIESSFGAGTRVVLRLPLSPAKTAAA